MIRAVLDTNILISALITKTTSAPLRLYKAFTKQEFLLITSPSILAEVEDVINRDKIVKYHKLSPKQREMIIRQLLILCYVTLESVKSEKVIIERDPKDDKFLHAAFEAHADYIVSGDNDLLDLKEYEGIKILSPNDFLAMREKLKADLSPDMYQALLRLAERELAKRIGQPQFSDGEHVRLIEDGEVKSDFIVVTDPKKALGADEVELFHPIRGVKDGQKKSEFLIVKRVNVVKESAAS